MTESHFHGITEPCATFLQEQIPIHRAEKSSSINIDQTMARRPIGSKLSSPQPVRQRPVRLVVLLQEKQRRAKDENPANRSDPGSPNSIRPCCLSATPPYSTVRLIILFFMVDGVSNREKLSKMEPKLQIIHHCSSVKLTRSMDAGRSFGKIFNPCMMGQPRHQGTMKLHD